MVEIDVRDRGHAAVGREYGRQHGQQREAHDHPHGQGGLGALPGSLRHIAGYHFGWWDADGTPAPMGDAQARVLVFYPLKALASDQFARWRAMASSFGLAPNLVARIDGNTVVIVKR